LLEVAPARGAERWSLKECGALFGVSASALCRALQKPESEYDNAVETRGAPPILTPKQASREQGAGLRFEV